MHKQPLFYSWRALWVLVLAGVLPLSAASSWRLARGAMPGGETTILVRTLSSDDTTQQVEFRFPAPVIQEGADGLVDVWMSSADVSMVPGAPVLPVMSARVALPQGHEVVSMEVVPGASHAYEVPGVVRHGEMPFPISRPEDWVETVPDQGIYGSDAAYPGTVFTPISVHTKRGVAFADVVLYPVVYRPASGRLTAYETLTVVLQTREMSDTGLGLSVEEDGWRARFRSEADAVSVASLLDNPEVLAQYQPEPLVQRDDRVWTTAGDLPPDPAETFHYVIITSEVLRDSLQAYNFQRLMALREAQGFPSIIVTLEDIIEVYSSGDDAARVRSFIRDAYNNWDTEYVLLGGDVNVLPIRRLQASVAGNTSLIPSDLYFQCLDGSFNSNLNNIYGEPDDGADRLDGRFGVDIDLYAEVAVGRVPVTNALMMANWVKKQVVYEEDRLAGVAPYLGGVLLAGEHLRFGGISEYAEPMLEEIRLGSSAHGYRTTGFEGGGIHTNLVSLNDNPYASWSPVNLAAQVNQEQFSVLNHIGHASAGRALKFRMPTFNASEDAELLLANDKPLFIYSQGCKIGDFSVAQVGEIEVKTWAYVFLTLSEHGFFGGVLNSDYGWGMRYSTDGPSQRYNRWFWHGLLEDLTPAAGLLKQQSHERNAARINDVAMRWIYYASNLLGDPAQWLHGVPEPFVRLDRGAYRSDGSAVVEVFWPLAGAGRREVNAELELRDVDGVTVTGVTNLVCRRRGPASYTGRYFSDPVALAGLGAVNGGLVIASADMSIGTNLVTYTDLSPIYDDPPAVSNLQMRAVDEIWMEVSWDSDRPVFGSARAGTALPLTGDWTTGPEAASESVTIRLENLTPYTLYRIGIRAEDGAGNVTNVPADLLSTNVLDYLSASTIGRETVVRYDWARDEQGWAVTNIAGQVCWEYGEPVSYGPQDAGRCWGTVLNGRYADGANARLTSPQFPVRHSPLIRFQHWHDIQYSPDRIEAQPSPVPYGDYGQIEVLSENGVWHNVTPYADVLDGRTYVSGSSDGWQDVRIILPPSFANQILALRFRFVSDEQQFDEGNPAGWYIRDIFVTDMPGSGLGISRVDIDDVEASGGASGVPGLVGDGDLFAEAGETVAFRPRLHNYGSDSFSALNGTLTVLVAGETSALATLVVGDPAPVSYAPIGPMETVPASNWTRLQLSSDIEPETVVTILQTVTNAAGVIFESSFDLMIDQYETISGRVEEWGTGIPIDLARIETVQGGETLLVISEADGWFDLHGLRAGTFYEVTASKAGAYSPVTQLIQAPETNALFLLGRSEGSVTPSNLLFSATSGLSQTLSLIFSNAATATVELNGELETVEYGFGAIDWLSLDVPSFSVGVGTSVTVQVTADASVLGVGIYDAVMVYVTDGPGFERVEIPIQFSVEQNPDLEFGGVTITDDDNGNGYWEPGESALLWIYLGNLSGISEAHDLDGVLESLTPAAVLNGPDTISWTQIPEYGTRLSDNGVGFNLDPGHPSGDPLDFRLTVSYGAGETNVFDFSYTPLAYHTVTGTVTLTLWAADPADVVVVPLEGARVTAIDAAGLAHTSMQTDTNGFYILNAVPEGDTWFSVYHSAVTNVLPLPTNVLVDTSMAVDFMVYNYGPGAPVLRLFDVVVNDAVHGDGDGNIDPGERLLLQARAYNIGASSAMSVTGLLAVADMGPVVPMMTVNVDVSDPPHTITPVSPFVNPAETPWILTEIGVFEVEVDPAAVDGDVQRFVLQIQDGQTPAWIWPFEFSLTVAPRYTLSGTVSYDDPTNNTPELLTGLMVQMDVDGSEANVLTAADGTFRMIGLQPGVDVELRLIAPEGFISIPDSRTVLSLAGDVGGLDFVLEADSLQVSPASFAVTLREGQSTNALLTLQNDGLAPLPVDLNVVYQRGMFDVDDPDADALASILGSLSAEQWANLSADVYAPNELEIRFADDVTWMERHEILEQHGLKALFHFTLIPACVAVPLEETHLSGEPSALGPVALSLQDDPRILYVQPSALIEPQALSNDMFIDLQYALNNVRQTGGTLGADINVEPLWAQGITGSRDIIVALFDTGMQLNHEDLVDNVWRNPLESMGDASGDGFPGIRGVDDDGDAESSRWHVNPLTGVLQGPEMVDSRFDPSMWADMRSLVPIPGKKNQYHWVDGANDIPDFLEPYILGVKVTPEVMALPEWYVDSMGFTNEWAADLVPELVDVNGDGVLDYSDLEADPRFVDTTEDGIPDLFADSVGDGIPDIFRDEDGDGVINETGIDFRDQDVMMADYYGIGRPLVIQKRVPFYWPGPHEIQVLSEQWHLQAMPIAAMDDDENGFANDLHGWNVVSWRGQITEYDPAGSHGTHVAGIVGASGNNGIGVSGVNWEVSLMPICVMKPSGELFEWVTMAKVAKGIEYALRRDARVSNHSWRSGQTSGILFEIMKRAEQDYNHLFVIAAGNSGANLDQTRSYPAYYSTVLNNIITVAASDHDGQLASFSTWGPQSVHLAAPGVDILSALGFGVLPMPDDEAASLSDDFLYYGYKSGSSMAAPHVAGAAALLWSYAPETGYDAIREAILKGARPDPSLAGRTRTGGNLDVARAFQALGRDWLDLSTNALELAAGGGTEDVELFFNTNLNLRAGQYEAEVIVSHMAGRRRVPVTLTVQEYPVASVADVRVVSDSDGDGYAEPGETVEFHVTLDNRGGGTFVNLTGTLAALTLGVNVDTAVADWDVLYGGDRGESLTAYQVTLPLGAPDPVEFELELSADGGVVQTLAVSLPVSERHSIRGRVETSDGTGVSGVTVECWGTVGARTVSGADGAYALHGLVDGNYRVRALPSDYSRSQDLIAVLAGADQTGANLTVGAMDPVFSESRLDAALPAGMATTQLLTVANAELDAYAFDIEVMPRRRIGIFTDGPGMEWLAEPLETMGFEVELFSGNFEIVHTIDPDTAVQLLEQRVLYTKDDANLFGFDLVIADLTGPSGGGRVLTATEEGAFERYLDRGGSVIFTGGNPLTRPDNEGLAALCGVAVTNRATTATAEVEAVVPWSTPFIELLTGNRVDTGAWIYDLAPVDHPDTELLFSAGAASKLVRRSNAGASGDGTVWLWSGNPAGRDWQQDGVWLNVLRSMLRDALMETAALQQMVPWLQLAPDSGAIAAGANDIEVMFDTAGLPPGTEKAVLVFIGPGPGGDVRSVPVTLTVDPHILRVFTTGSVVDWRNLPLRGDGGATSAIYQVIYAGADGVPDPPAINMAGQVTGSVTGDDRLLAVFPSREPFGRFGGGSGIPSDSGRFDRSFSVPVAPGTSNALVYVRAWDAASFASSLAYGDSTVLHELTFSSGESVDFGSWLVTNVIDYARDSNTNSLPDGWLMHYRPDLDPRAPLTPLESASTVTEIVVVPRVQSGDPAPKPYRVWASNPSNDFVFALDNANNRIAMIPSDDPEEVVYYGSGGSGPGQFGRPEGMAADPRVGHYRLAVADTDNHRIQTFTYDPLTGMLTFERAFGSYGNGDGQLDRPAAVAFDDVGRVFVADKVNSRIMVFRVSDGLWLNAFSGSGGNALFQPQGLSVDTDPTDGGVWVSDTGKHRMLFFSVNGVFKREFGEEGSLNGQFRTPVDVQVWRHRWTDPITGIERTVRRLLVVDKLNNRVQLFRPDGTWLMNIGAGGGSLAGQLRLPHGVFPVDDTREVWVADTDNGRLQRFRLTLDADQDGMDDFWEDAHGLDSTVFDAYGDLDGDGLMNIAEFLIQTDPSNPDTNGDGVSDGDSVQGNLDPRKETQMPEIMLLSASPSLVPAGSDVAFTLVFDQPPSPGETFALELIGSETGTVALAAQDAVTYGGTYQTGPSAFGLVDAVLYSGAISPADGGPDPVYLQSGLFSVFFPSFRITGAAGAPVQLTWESVPGAVYRIETNASLQAAGWGMLTNVVATGDPESIALDPLPSPVYFRIQRVVE